MRINQILTLNLPIRRIHETIIPLLLRNRTRTTRLNPLRIQRVYKINIQTSKSQKTPPKRRGWSSGPMGIEGEVLFTSTAVCCVGCDELDDGDDEPNHPNGIMVDADEQLRIANPLKCGNFASKIQGLKPYLLCIFSEQPPAYLDLRIPATPVVPRLGQLQFTAGIEGCPFQNKINSSFQWQFQRPKPASMKAESPSVLL